MSFDAPFIAALWLLAQAGPIEHFEQARAHERKNDWAAAERSYTLALRTGGPDAATLASLGVVLARQEKYDEAAGAYEHALKLRADMHAVRLNLGLAYYKSGRTADAIAQFNAYLKRNPSSRQARQLLATALLEADRYEEAARTYESLLPSDDLSLRFGLASAYARLGRAADAERLLGHIVREQQSAEVQLLLGQIHLAAHRHKEAVQALERALELNSNLPGVHFHLGAAAWKQQDADAAIAEWRKELAIDPRNFTALFVLGAALSTRSDVPAAEARQLLERARALRPRHAPTMYHLGKLAWAESRTQEAVKLLEEAVRADPAYREAHYLLATVYRSLGRKEDAARALATVQRLARERLERDTDLLEITRAESTVAERPR